MTNPMNMIGMNTHIGHTVDVEVWREEKSSWSKGTTALHHKIDGVPLAARTTTAASNDSVRERVQSGYTMYLDVDQIALLRAGDQIKITMPTGNKSVYELDGFREGIMWDLNPLSSNMGLGNEVNLKFIAAEEL